MANTKRFVAKNGLQADNIRLLSPDYSSEITLVMLDNGTLSFNGSNGQLFSITDDMTGTIFSVNDISGVPSIEVDDDGTIRFAEISGNVLIGTTTDNGTYKLQVSGGIYADFLSGDGSNLSDVNAITLEGNSGSYYLNWNNTTNKPSSDGIPEGTSNFYFTTPRARAAISVSGDLSYNSSTGVLSFNETYSSASDIKAAYESNTNTNAFTDSEQSKLSGIESGAQVNTVTSVAGKTGSVTLNTNDVSEGSNLYYTTERARAAISVSGDLSYSSGVISFNETYSTPSQIKSAYESNSNTNAFTDAEKTKLSGIEAGAEVNVGTNLGNSRNSTSYTITSSTGNNTTLSGATTSNSGVMTANDKSKLDGIESGAEVNSVRSVAGKTGSVTLSTSDVSEGSNQYFTSSRAQTAIKNDPAWNASNWDTAYSWGNHANAGYAQDSDISTVGKTGSYNDLTNKPDLSALEEVFVYSSESAFPSNGESDKVYIAEDTGYMYRWNGSGYTQLTDQTAIWGNIDGTLSNQSDLQNALDGKANNSHTHSSSDLPSTLMYEGDNISLLNNNSGYITASGAPVQSVAGKTGSVSLSTSDISEGSRLYHTTSRVRAAISVSGDLSYNSSTGVISFNETYSSPSDIKDAYESNSDTNVFTNSLLSKLNGIESGAQVNVGTNLGISGTGNDRSITSSTGSNVSIPTATTSNAGFFSTGDKSKLDGIESGAQANVGDTFNSSGDYTNLRARATTKDDVGLGNVGNYSRSYYDNRYLNLTGGEMNSGSAIWWGDSPGSSGSYGIYHNTPGGSWPEIPTYGESGSAHGTVIFTSSRGALSTGNGGARHVLTWNRSGNVDVVNGRLTVNGAIYSDSEVVSDSVIVGTSNDGVNDFQVGGDASLRGNTGFGNDDPSHRVDVAGDVRVREENSMKFGGTGSEDAQFAIQFNAATKSLDFNFIGA